MVIRTLRKCLVIYLMSLLIKESTPFKLVTKQEFLDPENELASSQPGTAEYVNGNELEAIKDVSSVRRDLETEAEDLEPFKYVRNGVSEPSMRNRVSEPSMRIATSEPSTHIGNIKATMLAKFKEFDDSAAQKALLQGDIKNDNTEYLETADQKTSKYPEAPEGKNGSSLKGESYDKDAFKGRGLDSNDPPETDKRKPTKTELEEHYNTENDTEEDREDVDGSSEENDETHYEEKKDDVKIESIHADQENSETKNKEDSSTGQQILPNKKSKKLRVRRDSSMESDSKNIDVEEDKLDRKALTDVTVAATNERQEAVSTSGDVTDGVGGSSMNELLEEMFRASLPAVLEPTEGDCHHLSNFTVRCSSNMFSMCGTANSYMNVMVENGHGGHKFTKERPMAYGVSPITGRDNRWELSDSPNLWDLMPDCTSCFGKSPLVRIVGPKGSLCRVRIHCASSPDEALYNLPSDGQTKCSRTPFVRTRAKLLKLPDRTEYSTGTNFELGETLVLRVEAEADFTSSSLLGDGRFISLTDSKPQPIGIHVQKCWVGSEDTNQANLVIDGCSTAPVIGNFTEFTTAHSQTPYNRVIGVTKRENDERRDVLSKRVVQETNITAFVMSRSDQKVDITCMVKVCVGVCPEKSDCLQSSRPKEDSDTHPLYSMVHNLTVSMSPATDLTKIQSAATEEKQSQVNNKPNLEANVNKNSSLTNKTTLEAQRYSKESINTLSEGGCLSYSTFILSLTIISILYLVLLVAFVVLHNKKSAKEYNVSAMSPPHMVCTPSRTYFPDEFTARKRTPPSITDRYIY